MNCHTVLPHSDMDFVILNHFLGLNIMIICNGRGERILPAHHLYFIEGNKSGGNRGLEILPVCIITL